jgi:ABC-type nitrate/sulfonate/bicarbonate transport system permease component
MKREWLWRWAVLAVVGAWQAWAVWRGSPFFPPPTVIAARMYDTWFSGPPSHLFLTPVAAGNILPSLARVADGLAIAVAVAVPAGLAIGRSPAVMDYLDPMVGFARSIPPVALVPVFIVIFKLGTQMEVATIAFGAVWPVLLNTIDGARSIDQTQLDTARAYRLSWHQRVTRLIIPASAPKIFAGLRLDLSLALVVMVVAELVGSSNGIGYELENAANTFDLPGLWSGIVLLGILGYLLNAALLAVEHRVLAWHRDAR